MPKFQFNKLVRNKIIEHQIKSGASPSYRKLTEQEHKKALVKKIVEEANEITRASSDEIAGEIADVQQALDDLKILYHLTSEGILQAQRAKSAQNGNFNKGIFLEYVELPESDKWVKYYRDNPSRYPELS